jgi:DNA-binding PadR family transcriptional regulator
MPIPSITFLQYLVLSILLDGEISGRELRARMAEAGEKKTGPSFYQFMSRLETGNLVRGWYDPKVVDGQPIKERRYKITGSGITAWENAEAFRRTCLALGGMRGTANA